MNKLLLAVQGISMAMEAIRANKVRAVLTIAGVAIGVFVVVAMGSVVTGIRASFQQDVDAIGATTFIVQRRSPGISACDGTDDTCPDRRNPRITVAEWASLRRLPGVAGIIGVLGGGGAFSYRGNRLESVGFDAYSPEWPEIDAADISPGRNFTNAEYRAGQPVVLINDTLRTQLFGESDPIGKEIQVNGRQFTVIGVFQPRAGFLKTLQGKGPETPRAIVPLTTAVRQLKVAEIGLSLLVRPVTGVAQSEVMDLVIATLRMERGLKARTPNTFYLVEQDRLMDTFDQLFGAIFAVGLALSAVALLVGGVGVVAIMMISVTERTVEIGVRKALGATAGIIRWQFLVEAATLTSVGAIAGLLAGSALAWIIRANTSIPAQLPVRIVVTALVSSAFTGIVFGMLPAYRASRLDPVEALRHE